MCIFQFLNHIDFLLQFIIIKNFIYTSFKNILNKVFWFRSIYEIRGGIVYNMYYHYIVWNTLYKLKLHYYYPIRFIGKIFIEYHNKRKFKTLLYAASSLTPSELTRNNCLNTFIDLKRIVQQIDDNPNQYKKIMLNDIERIELVSSHDRKNITELFNDFVQFEKPLGIIDIIKICKLNKNFLKLIITYFPEFEFSLDSNRKNIEINKTDNMIDLRGII